MPIKKLTDAEKAANREKRATKRMSEPIINQSTGLVPPPPADPCPYTPPEKQIAASDGMVDVEIFEKDYDEDRWKKVIKRVPQGQAAQIVAEPDDIYADNPMWLGPEWEEGRGRFMHARWANINPDHQTNERIHNYSYVHPSDFKSRRYHQRKIDGLARPVFSLGDAVLMEVPKDAYDQRQARNVERKQRELREMVGLAEDEGADRLKHELGQGGYARYTRGETTVEYDATDMEADAEIDAMQSEVPYQMYGQGVQEPPRGRKSFAGLQGNPQYDHTDRPGPKPNYGYRPPQ